jgi:MFS family permease
MICNPPNVSEARDMMMFRDEHWLGHLFPGIGFMLIALFLLVAPFFERCFLRQLGKLKDSDEQKVDFFQFAYFTTFFIGFTGAAVALGVSHLTNWNHSAMLFSFSLPQLALLVLYERRKAFNRPMYYMGLAVAFLITYIVVDLHGIVHSNSVQVFMHAVLEYGLLASAGLLLLQTLFFNEYLYEKEVNVLALLLWNFNIMVVLSNGIWFVLLGYFVHTEQGYEQYVVNCTYHSAGGHFGAMLCFGLLAAALILKAQIRNDVDKICFELTEFYVEKKVHRAQRAKSSSTPRASTSSTAEGYADRPSIFATTI